MSYGISFTNIGIILLDVLLVWACLSVDKHLKLLDLEDQKLKDLDEYRFKQISHLR